MYNADLDSSNNLFLAGVSLGTHLPLTNPLYNSFGGDRDGFVVKFDTTGNVEFSTYFGGLGFDDPFGSTIDLQGNFIISGRTQSDNYPIYNGEQSEFGGEVDGIITVFEDDGQSLLYSSYFGGVGWETIHDVAVTSSGKIMACGISGPNFPLQNPIQDEISGDNNFIMMQLDADYSIEFSSYFAEHVSFATFLVPRKVELNFISFLALFKASI